MKDKDLRKKIKAEFEKPEISFKEWADKNSIYSKVFENNAEDCLVCQTADDVGGQIAVQNNKKRMLIIGAAVVAFILVIAIILICILPRMLAPKVYGVNDVVSIDIELQEITDNEDIYLFDMSGVVQTQAITKDVLKSDNSKVMLYALTGNLVSVSNEDEYDGFYVTYKIRNYRHYEFVNVDSFLQLDKETTINNFSISYKILDRDGVKGYAYFTVNDYEYFIEARGYQDITVLNEDNFINLLNKILI